MSETKPKSTGTDERQKQIGLWAAGIFAILGLAFVIFWAYNVLVLQNGKADLSDRTLLPVTILMFLAGLGSFILIRRNRLVLGLWLVYLVVLIPPVMAVLVLGNVYPIAITYLAVFAPISIVWMFPRSIRQAAIIAATAALLAIVGIEIWNPDYRLASTALTNFAPYMIALGALALLAFSIRQAMTGNIRTKLLVTFIGITLLSMTVFGIVANQTTHAQIISDVGNILQTNADAQARSVGDFLDNQLDTLTIFGPQFRDVIVDVNATYTGNTATIQAELEQLDREWQAADQAGNNADPLVYSRLNNATASELLKFRQAFPENAEVFLTDRFGAVVATTNRTSDYYQADETWWQAAYNNGNGKVYIGELEYDESSQVYAIIIAVPIYAENSSRAIGVLRTTVTIQGLVDTLTSSLQGLEETHTDMLFSSGMVLAEGNLEEMSSENQSALRVATRPYMEFAFEGVPSFVSVSTVQSEDNPAVEELGWVVITHQNRQAALAPANAQLRTIVIAGLAIAGLIFVVILLFARAFTTPIMQLTETAQKVSSGDLAAEASVTTSDEIGQLATSFNSMTSQLRELVGSLEQRVAARTKDLATVTEVGTATATILETDKLLQAVVDLTKERFNLYHSHIYLLDESGENLVLASGAGEPGRQMKAKGLSIPLSREQSLVARAARERKGVIVNDVTQAPDFLPNPLLPDTRSELAVPMIVGSNLIGVFDVQSDQIERFTESDINIQTTLAAQVATSIQNVRSFEQSQKQANLESLVNAIGQKIQRAATVEDTLQTAIREIGLALGASRVKASIGVGQQNGGNTANNN
jgi:putative methionine-R-sulfoxide reductase with GAF domain